MNHIYRIIWNDARACFEAVAETAGAKGKRSLGKRERGVRALALAAGLAAAAQALAAPAGGQVSAGQGDIAQSGGTTTITQSTPRLAINWQSFGIAGNETVNFVQPGANAVALNRVLGTEASQIMGRLNANGQVFLLNPNGVLFGQSAQVSVGGLVASTLGMSDADFMAGRYVLRDGSGRGGSVRNEGTIRAADGGSIALVGGEVSNTGTLVANLGTVALAAGKQVTLDFSGDGLLKLAVDEGAVNALAHNGGLMQADGGTALLTAKAADALAGTVVNNTGVIQARTLENRGGVIKLLGGFNGGTVQVGGTLDASAPTGGDGGFVDTSGAHVKVAEGTRVSTRAAQGKTGTWLIDPADFTIAASGGDISGATLSSNLANSDVTILSSSGGTAAGNGDINVNDNVNWAANTLTLTAARDINIRAVMDATGSSALVMNTGTANGADAGVAGGKVKVAVDPVTGFAGRVNFDRAGTGFLTINGEGYIVINTLGTEGSATGLQSINLEGSLRYALGADIDAAATATWNGNQGASPLLGLSGTLDGLGHSISNLKIRTVNNGGLFAGINGGTVRNLDLAGVTGGVDEWYGTLAGSANGATLHNLRASGTLTGPGHDVGGLVGLMTGGTLQDAHARVTVNMTSAGLSDVGGLVGTALNTAMRDVSASGDVTATGYNDVGGLIGRMQGGSLENARATGKVKGAANVGGLIGANGNPTAATSGANLVNVSAAGNVTGIGFGSSTNRNVGGLIGWNFGNISQASATGEVLADGLNQYSYSGIGGLVGVNHSGSISDSHATGAVTATNLVGKAQYVGGLAGSSTGDMTSVYATGDVKSNGDYTGGLVGSSTGTLTTVYATGNVTSGGNYTGGLVGKNIGAVTDAYSNALTVDGPGNYTGGLIGDHSGGDIQNARSNANLTSQGQYTGGLIGRSTGAALTHARASGSVTNTGTGVGAAGHWVGGLVGHLNGGSLTDGQASGAVTGYYLVGGLVGLALGTIDNAKATGDVTGLYQATGGLVGSALAPVSNAEATGNVTGGLDVGGLIGRTVYDVTDAVARGRVEGVSQVGGLIGTSGNLMTVRNARAEGAVRATGTGDSEAGGLIGYSESLVVNSSATGRVEANGNMVGGLIGHSRIDGPTDSLGWMENLYATGDVSGAGSVGGLVGAGGFLNPGWVAKERFRAVYASGNVTGTGDAVGGLIGYGGAASLTDAYATGSVTGAARVGGLIGEHIVGALNRTYATGAVTGNSATGGLIGTSIGGVTNSYWDTVSTGQATSPVGTGKTSAQMKQAATFAGWSIDNLGGTGSTWRIYEGQTGPLLRSFLVAQNVANVSAVYNAATQAGSVVAPSGTRTGTAASGRNAGTYTAFSGQQGLDIVGGLLTITPAALTVSGVTASDKVYDGTSTATLDTGSGALSGVLGSDSVAINLAGATGSFADKNVGNAKAVTVTGAGLLSGADAGNYTVSSPAGLTASITPKALTVSGVSAGNKVYDGNATAALNTGAAALSGVIGGDTVAVNLSGVTGSFADKNVGTAKAVSLSGAGLLSGADAGNYSVSNPAGLAADITPKALTISGITAGDKVYDGGTAATVNTSGASYTGLVSGDALTVSATGSFGDKNVGNGKIVTLASSYGGADLGNYSITGQASTTASITPKALTISGITAGDKVYDGGTAATVNTSGASYTGLVSGDALNVSATGSFGDKNVGTGKTVSLASSYRGADLGNYSITGQATTTASITPKALTVGGITAGDKVYDGGATATVNTSGASYTGLVGGDDLTVSATGSFGNKNVGNGKTVTLASSYGGADAGNYSITGQASTTANITPKALTVTGIAAGDKVYDGGTTATVNTSGASYTGLVSGDALTVSATGSFGDKNVGNGKTVTLASSYSGADLGNYSITDQATTTARITPKALTMGGITAGDKVYDGGTAATVNTSGASYTGLVGGDDLTVSATGSFGDKNAGNGKTVTLATSYSGADLGNYSITGQATTTASITPKGLTVSGVTAGNKVYDGSTAATVNTAGATYSGLIGGDDLTLTVTGTFADKHAATGKTVTLAGNYSGADAGNYAITGQTATTADITPAALTVTAQADNRVYNGSTASSVGPVVTGTLYDAIGSAATQSFDNRNAGTGKTLNAAGLVMNDGNGGNNYAVSYVANTGGVITPASLSVVADNQAKQANTADPLLTYTTGPFAAGDSAASVLSGQLQRAAGEQAGAYAINQGLLASNGNYTIDYTPGSLVITAAPVLGTPGQNEQQQAARQKPLPVPEVRQLFACADSRGNCGGELPVRVVDEGLRMPAVARGPRAGLRETAE
ncbi:YDG domain-containing protein [Polaromonas sp. YR568]|uniref:YDG domain-containing protein n=1 Tax=Polaromonas sp. YR568 TaxID=1855301 RepID=UPI00398BBF44